jgi:hypothetical protein
LSTLVRCALAAESAHAAAFGSLTSQFNPAMIEAITVHDMVGGGTATWVFVLAEIAHLLNAGPFDTWLPLVRATLKLAMPYLSHTLTNVASNPTLSDFLGNMSAFVLALRPLSAGVRKSVDALVGNDDEKESAGAIPGIDVPQQPAEAATAESLAEAQDQAEEEASLYANIWVSCADPSRSSLLNGVILAVHVAHAMRVPTLLKSQVIWFKAATDESNVERGFFGGKKAMKSDVKSFFLSAHRSLMLALSEPMRLRALLRETNQPEALMPFMTYLTEVTTDTLANPQPIATQYRDMARLMRHLAVAWYASLSAAVQAGARWDEPAAPADSGEGADPAVSAAPLQQQQQIALVDRMEALWPLTERMRLLKMVRSWSDTTSMTFAPLCAKWFPTSPAASVLLASASTAAAQSAQRLPPRPPSSPTAASQAEGTDGAAAPVLSAADAAQLLVSVRTACFEAGAAMFAMGPLIRDLATWNAEGWMKWVGQAEKEGPSAGAPRAPLLKAVMVHHSSWVLPSLLDCIYGAYCPFPQQLSSKVPAVAQPWNLLVPVNECGSMIEALLDVVLSQLVNSTEPTAAAWADGFGIIGARHCSPLALARLALAWVPTVALPSLLEQLQPYLAQLVLVALMHLNHASTRLSAASLNMLCVLQLFYVPANMTQRKYLPAVLGRHRSALLLDADPYMRRNQSQEISAAMAAYCHPSLRYNVIREFMVRWMQLGAVVAHGWTPAEPLLIPDQQLSMLSLVDCIVPWFSLFSLESLGQYCSPLVDALVLPLITLSRHHVRRRRAQAAHAQN